MSLTLRALIAILLMIGFYVLALGVSAGLLWIVYMQWTSSESINLRLTLFCVAGAGLIFWSILPRVDRFEAPGPRINANQQPRLFAELSTIAKGLGQQMPHEVYLIPDVNAWVAQRGGMMGIGGRRVMALGMPLIGLLTVSQLRAVLAHEFGHYHGGDTKLGPWIYKTRAAIGRTLTQLGRHRSALVFLFKWYGEMFLKVTLGISRAQEYAADRLAAQLAGTNALVDGLKQIHRGVSAWQYYLKTELFPVLSAGYSPPVAGGFAYFLQTPQIETPVNQSLEKTLREGKAEPFDSHPALPERIAALQGLSFNSAADTRPATDLLTDFESADRSLFAANANPALKPVKWEQVLNDVWVPHWRQQINSQRDALGGITAADIPEQLSNGALAKRIKSPPHAVLDFQQRADLARNVIGFAFSLLLLNDGWTCHALPGEMYCEKNGQRIDPFEIIHKLDRRQITADHWKELCTRAGIINLVLLPKAATGTAAN